MATTTTWHGGGKLGRGRRTGLGDGNGGASKGGKEQELTGMRQGRSAGSGTSCRRRIDVGGDRLPRRKKMRQSVMQAIPALGARLGRSGDRGRGFGACRRGEGKAVAVVELVGALGCSWSIAREREQRGIGTEGEIRESERGSRGPRGVSRE